MNATNVTKWLWRINKVLLVALFALCVRLDVDKGQGYCIVEGSVGFRYKRAHLAYWHAEGSFPHESFYASLRNGPLTNLCGVHWRSDRGWTAI